MPSTTELDGNVHGSTEGASGTDGKDLGASEGKEPAAPAPITEQTAPKPPAPKHPPAITPPDAIDPAAVTAPASAPEHHKVADPVPIPSRPATAPEPEIDPALTDRTPPDWKP